jgi:hypothetical protein
MGVDMKCNYTVIYDKVYDILNRNLVQNNKSTISHADLHFTSIKITDGIWEIALLANRTNNHASFSDEIIAIISDMGTPAAVVAQFPKESLG